MPVNWPHATGGLVFILVFVTIFALIWIHVWRDEKRSAKWGYYWVWFTMVGVNSLVSVLAYFTVRGLTSHGLHKLKK